METLAPGKVESNWLPTEKLKSERLSVRRIIAAVDLTRKCEATVRYAAAIARHHGALLYITYVFWPSMRARGDYLIDQEQRESLETLKELANQVRDIVPSCKSALLVGEPAKRVSALARDIQADLIATSSYYQILLNSLIRTTPCSILVYHEADIC